MKVFKGLGKNVSAAKNDPREILNILPELDFTPKVMQSYFGEEGEREWTLTSPIPDEFRIINDRTYGVIDGGHTVSKNYKTHPIKEILSSLCEICERSSLTLSDIVMLRGGEHILLRAESGKTFAPVVGDTYGGSVLFKISNVPGIVSSCSAYVIRLVCTNGATAKEDLGSGVMKLHHRRDYDNAAREEVEKLSQSLEVALKSYEEKIAILYNAPLPIIMDVEEFFFTLLDISQNVDTVPRTVRTLTEVFHTQPGKQLTNGTYGELYNAVTYWVDHVRGRKPESALFSTIYGDGARLKRKALQLTLEMIKENQ